MVVRSLAVSCVAILALSACGGSESAAGPKSCQGHSECAEKSYCSAGWCVYDAEAPAVAISSPAADQLFSTATVTVAGTIGDATAGIGAAEYSTDGANFAALEVADGRFALELPLGALDNAPLTITVRARDNAQNAATASVTIRVDRVAPRVQLADPPKLGFGAADIGTDVQFSGTATDGSPIARTELSLDGSSWTEVSPPGAFTYPYRVGATATGQTIAVKARATDAAGNVSEVVSSKSVFIETVVPELALTSPAEGQVYKPGDSTLRIAGTVADDNLTRTAYKLDDGPERELTVTDGAYSVDIPLEDEDGTQHRVTVVAIDRANNTVSLSRTVTVDTLAPRLSLSAPVDGALFTLADPAKLKVAGAVVEADLKSLTWQLDQDPVHALTPAAGPIAFDIALAAEDNVPHTLTIVARDRSGNETSVTRSYRVDRVAPMLTITTPSADASCAATRCTGGVINLGSGATYTFRGKVSDGAGLRAGGLTASVATQSGPPTLSAADWAFPWPALPADNGAEYTFTVTATDLVGNVAQLRRKVWLDRVGPTVTTLVDGRRLLPRTEPLIRFSEEMDATSVGAATLLNAMPPSALFGATADGKAWGFSSANGLQPYTIYDMTVGVGATDPAGNPLPAQASQRFLTQAVPPPPQTTVTTYGTSPAIAVDYDGNPLVVFWAASNSTFRAARWDGRGNFVTTYVPIPDAPSDGQAVEVKLTSQPDADLSLKVRARAVMVGDVSGTRRVYFAENGNTTWHGRMTANADVIATTAPAAYPSFGGLTATCAAETIPGVCTGWNVNDEPVLRYHDSTTSNVSERQLAAGSLGTPRTLWAAPTPLRSMRGSGLALATAIHVTTATNTNLTIDAANGGGVIAGVDRVQSIGLANKLVESKSAWLAWAQFVTQGAPNLPAYPTLHRACSSDPKTASSWKKSSPVELTANRYYGHPITSMRMEASGSTVGLAIETSKPGVFFASFPNDDCATPPALITLPAELAGKQPAIAFDRHGAMWGAYVKTTGELVLLRP